MFLPSQVHNTTRLDSTQLNSERESESESESAVDCKGKERDLKCTDRGRGKGKERFVQIKDYDGVVVRKIIKK